MIEKNKLVGLERFEYAPMIREQTSQHLLKLLREKQPKNILEIGTFLGYSAGLILENCPNATLVTVEKDPQKVEDARKNLAMFGKRCEVVCADAIDFLQNETRNSHYDFIFLDGAKGQYHKYLPFLKESLKKDGVLFVDDIMYYGLVKSQAKIIHKHRSIVNNLRKFLAMLENDEGFETQVFEIEDGFSVSIKK